MRRPTLMRYTATTSLPMNPMTPARRSHPAQMAQRHGIDEPANGFDGGDERGDGDDRHHEQAGQVLHATESVGVAPRRRASAHREGYPERYGGQGIGEVVHGVGEQRDRTRYGDDGQLYRRGDAEDHQADLDRADTCGTVTQRIVDAVGVVVRMADPHYPVPFSCRTRSSRSSR